MRIQIAAALAAALAVCAAQAQAQPAAKAANDYSDPATWLCRPGKADFCDIDLTATAVNPDGSYARRPWTKAAAPEVDCFYVYPTVAGDQTPNSDMVPGAEERAVAARQLARFGETCRIFAPLYRQITIPALRALMAGQSVAVDRELAYRDVVDAWNHYLQHENQGRGVVLYGHSQGAGVLKRLIAEEIDGKPIQKRIVSALLIGTNVLVPQGQDVGGDFKSMPLCRSRAQAGCVVSYVTFRDRAPPPANSRFGRTTAPGMQVACVNPAQPEGGWAAMRSVFGTASMHPTAAPPRPWADPMRPIETPFVMAPGLLSGRCVSDEHGTYLAIRVNADPKDPRTDEISGDHLDAQGRVQADWGLHSLDVPVAMGDLIALVGDQARAWKAAQ